MNRSNLRILPKREYQVQNWYSEKPTRPSAPRAASLDAEPNQPGSACSIGDEIQEPSGGDDSHAVVLTNIEEIRVPGHDERRATGDGTGDVHVIVGVCAQSRNVNVFAHELRQHDEVFKPERWINLRSSGLLHLGIRA